MKTNGTGPKGKQDIGTPVNLLNAIKDRFGALGCDLAATADNAVCVDFISPKQDSLKTPWPGFTLKPGRRPDGPINLWLNPPFADIAPWAKKCAEWTHGHVHPQSRLLFLVPASVDSNWWRDFVSAKARVLSLAPRLTFVGHDDPFPKSMTLCVYEPAWKEQPRTVEPWRWDTPYMEPFAEAVCRIARTRVTDTHDDVGSCLLSPCPMHDIGTFEEAA